MTAPWMSPPDEPVRHTTPEERAALLVELLHLSDAYPPVPRKDLDAPTFRELCEPR